MRADFQTEKISCYELIMEENEDYVSDCSGERLGRPNKTLHARIQVLTNYYSNRSCQLIVVQQSQSSDKKNCTFSRCVFVFEFCNSRRIYRRSTGTTKPFQIYNRCGHFWVKKKRKLRFCIAQGSR